MRERINDGSEGELKEKEWSKRRGREIRGVILCLLMRVLRLESLHSNSQSRE